MIDNKQIQGINNAIEQKKKEHQRKVDSLNRQKDKEKEIYDRQIQTLKNQKQYVKDTNKKKEDSSYRAYVSASKTESVYERLNREIEALLED